MRQNFRVNSPDLLLLTNLIDLCFKAVCFENRNCSENDEHHSSLNSLDLAPFDMKSVSFQSELK